MHKLKKAAAVAIMVGGIGLAGGGVASASGGHGYDEPFPYNVAIENLQVVECDQTFEVGDDITPDVETFIGDAVTNEGNFCTVIGSVED